MIVRDQPAVNVGLSERAAVAKSRTVQSQRAVRHGRSRRVRQVSSRIINIGGLEHHRCDNVARRVFRYGDACIRCDHLLIIRSLDGHYNLSCACQPTCICDRVGEDIVQRIAARSQSLDCRGAVIDCVSVRTIRSDINRTIRTSNTFPH